jgi:hypothetical protein
MLLEISWTIEFSPSLVPVKAPASPAGVFFSQSGRSVAAGTRRAAPLCSAHASDREARPDRQGGELIDRIATSAPIGKLLLVEALGHARVPFAGFRPDHRAEIELAAIDAHRAAETAADLEGGFDDRVAGDPRGDRLEIGDFPDGLRWVYKRSKGGACPPSPA